MSISADARMLRFRLNWRMLVVGIALIVACELALLGLFIRSLPLSPGPGLVWSAWLIVAMTVFIVALKNLLIAAARRSFALEISEWGLRNNLIIAGYVGDVAWQQIDRVEVYRDYGSSGNHNLRVWLRRPLCIDSQRRRSLDYWLHEWSRTKVKGRLDFGLVWYSARPDEILQAIQGGLAASRAKERASNGHSGDQSPKRL